MFLFSSDPILVEGHYEKDANGDLGESFMFAISCRRRLRFV